jgi:hypothetical protein
VCISFAKTLVGLAKTHTMAPQRSGTSPLLTPPQGTWPSVMCLTAWLITNAGAGLCIRMRRGNSLISATWPRLLPRCGITRRTGAGQHPLVGCDRFWGHARGHASRSTAPTCLGWLGSLGVLEFPDPPMHISCQTPGRVVAPTSGLSRSAERCRKDARSDSRQVPSPSRVRDSGSLSVFRCRAQNPHRGSMPTPDARPE